MPFQPVHLAGDERPCHEGGVATTRMTPAEHFCGKCAGFLEGKAPVVSLSPFSR